MTGPLATGHELAKLNTNSVLADPSVQIRSAGERFGDLGAAEERARHLSKGEQGDAVVLRDRDGSFWVYRTDEFSKIAGKRGADAARQLLESLNLPQGVELQRLHGQRQCRRGRREGAGARRR
jgi:hypothetical protein